MRNVFKRKKKNDEKGVAKTATCSPSQGEPSHRHASLAYTREVEARDDEFSDDASTIRPAQSVAGSSIFDDNASTLQPDTYSYLGADDRAEPSPSRALPPQRLHDGEPLHVNHDGSYAGPLLNRDGDQLGGWRRPPVRQPQQYERANYWHEPRDFEPFNPFEEVARLSQKERVALAMKNARGPQYSELSGSGSRGVGFGSV